MLDSIEACPVSHKWALERIRWERNVWNVVVHRPRYVRWEDGRNANMLVSASV